MSASESVVRGRRPSSAAVGRGRVRGDDPAKKAREDRKKVLDAETQMDKLRAIRLGGSMYRVHTKPVGGNGTTDPAPPQGYVTIICNNNALETHARALLSKAESRIAPPGDLECFRVDPNSLVFTRIGAAERGYASPAHPGKNVQMVCNGVRDNELYKCLGVALNVREGDGRSDSAITVVTRGNISINNTGPDTIHEGAMVAWRPRAFNSNRGHSDSKSMLGIRGWADNQHFFETYEWKDGDAAATAMLYDSEIKSSMKKMNLGEMHGDIMGQWKKVQSDLKTVWTVMNYPEELRPSQTYCAWSAFNMIVSHHFDLVALRVGLGFDGPPMIVDFKSVCNLFVAIYELDHDDPLTREWRENIRMVGGPLLEGDEKQDSKLYVLCKALAEREVGTDLERELKTRLDAKTHMTHYAIRRQVLSALAMEAFRRHYLIGKCTRTGAGGKQIDVFLGEGLQ